jgi:heme/copper-type cytochrome/quinol oxidase subunit 2
MKRFLMIMVATAVFSSAAYAQEVEPPVVAISETQLQFTPNQITLKRGETVTLRVTSTDRIKRFSSKQLGFKVDIMPNQPRDITITPEKAGRFVATSDHLQLVIDVE